MVLINYATKEIIAKIVYYGPALCGKTTNLQQVYAKLNPQKRGKMISLATEADRTLFFDFLPMELGVVQGFKVRFQLYTVPGQVFYGATRKLVLKGADAVVFVADSQPEIFDKNVESIEDMKNNLIDNNLDPDTIPILFQWNKRDIPNVMSEVELNARLNYRGAPSLGSAAVNGEGVMESFREITKLLIQDLKRKHSMMDTDQISELPPEVFEPRKKRTTVKEHDVLPEAEYELVLGSSVYDAPAVAGEDEVMAGELVDRIETIELSDYMQAEAFFDDVRKGQSINEAKENAEQISETGPAGAEDLGSVSSLMAGERELTPEELEFSGPEMAEGEEEIPFEFQQGSGYSEGPEGPVSGSGLVLDNEALPPPPPDEKEFEVDVPPAPELDVYSIDYEQASPEATPPPLQKPVLPPAPVTEFERLFPSVPDAQVTAPDLQAKVAPPVSAPKVQLTPGAQVSSPKAQPSAAVPASTPKVQPPIAAPVSTPKAQPPVAPPVSAPQVQPPPAPRPVEQPPPSDAREQAPHRITAVIEAIERLSKEVSLIRTELSDLKESISSMPLSERQGDTGPLQAEPATSRGLDEMMKTLKEAFDGQDRLLLSVLEAVRDSKKISADAHEKLEVNLRYIIDKFRREDPSGAKKKWF